MDADAQLDHVKKFLTDLQTQLCSHLNQQDAAAFVRDPWVRAEGGGGLSCVLSGGDVLEKAAVNFSHVHGHQLPPGATLRRPELANTQFQAMGVSVIIHPRNPYAPTTHANFRFFQAIKTNQDPIWWFGGGFDLTPYYLNEEDCRHWHASAAKACQPFGIAYYHRYKQWCDEYFYLKHRQEARGVGGLFFDDLNEISFEHCFALVKSLAEHFQLAYWPILERQKDKPYGERERNFQIYRRGRYVEFNLLHDRGTLFGLQSNGRIESILASLPPLVSWHYAWQAEADSAEAALLECLQKPRNWWHEASEEMMEAVL